MKRFLSVMLMAVLVLALGVTGAYADEQDGGNWSVVFTSDADMKEDYPNSATKIATILEEMQPGDETTIYMTLSNEYGESTDWYMENEVLQSLEAARKAASGGGYTYDLTYEGPGGSRELFSSDKVGGEGDGISTVSLEGEDGLEGLEYATTALENYFYLDTLDRGQSGRLALKVKLDGETQGNAYQRTLAKLQMNFAVELNDTTPWRPVRTGDESNMLLWSGVMLGCGLAALVLGVYVMRRGRKSREGDEDE